jgi:ribokinase
MTDCRGVPSIAALGVLSWDELFVVDSYPVEGGFAMIQRTLSGPGGTTGNIAMTARRLGADVSLYAKVGSDQRGAQILESVQATGIRTDGCLQADGETDLSMVLVSAQNAERTIIWKQGPHIRRRDQIDIDRLFGADVTVIDCVDHDLRTFLTDLPAHTRPGACLLGTLTYLSDVVARNTFEVALRHDILIGNEREYQRLVGLENGHACLKAVAAAMPGNNLRLAVMTAGDRGAQAATRNDLISARAVPLEAIDSTGAGDAFVGAFAFAHASRWDLQKSLTFANSVASCAVTALGAQSGLPTYAEAIKVAGFSS